MHLPGWMIDGGGMDIRGGAMGICWFWLELGPLNDRLFE